MKHGTAIEWTHLPGYKGETWNPWVGCSPVSEGCKNCWAVRQANRFKNRFPQYEGTVKDGKWTGCVNRTPAWQFRAPIPWDKPRAVFPCSMSDFFHPGADEWRERAWHTIYDTPQHLYLILTKRPERIPDCLPSFGKKEWPWPNVWLGASVENGKYYQRIFDLLKVQATKRFLSLEPLLGPIDLTEAKYPRAEITFIEGIDWVIVGGESGPGARPMHPDWPRGVRDQCQASQVPYFFKQHGEWAPRSQGFKVGKNLRWGTLTGEGEFFETATPWNGHDDDGIGGEAVMVRVGKKLAGRILGGETWEEFPL